MTTTIGLFRNATDFQSFPAGKVIFEEGDAGNQMFVVKDGEIDIVVHGHVVETIAAGGIFGEMALIEGGVRSARAVARTDCALVPIDERRFSFLIQQTPQFGLQVMKIMAERLRRIDQKL
jgi:CRP-like cAMP-binding protein